MKKKIQLLGGSSLGQVTERLRKAGAYIVQPGTVEKISLSSFAITIDWPEWNEKAVQEELKTLKKDYGVEILSA